MIKITSIAKKAQTIIIAFTLLGSIFSCKKDEQLAFTYNDLNHSTFIIDQVIVIPEIDLNRDGIKSSDLLNELPDGIKASDFSISFTKDTYGTNMMNFVWLEPQINNNLVYTSPLPAKLTSDINIRYLVGNPRSWKYLLEQEEVQRAYPVLDNYGKGFYFTLEKPPFFDLKKSENKLSFSSYQTFLSNEGLKRYVIHASYKLASK